MCCEGKMRRGKSDKSNLISLSKKLHLFYTKKLTFSIVVAFLNFNFLFFILFFPYLFFFFFSSTRFFSFFLLHTFPLSLSSLFFFSFIYSTLFGALSSYLHFSFFFSSLALRLELYLQSSLFFFLFLSSTTSTPEHSRSTTACPPPTEAQTGQFALFFFGSNLISFKIVI